MASNYGLSYSNIVVAILRAWHETNNGVLHITLNGDINGATE